MKRFASKKLCNIINLVRVHGRNPLDRTSLVPTKILGRELLGVHLEAPELTDKQLANAVLSVGGKRRGRPPSERLKQTIKLRLDTDI